ncbi:MULTISPECIES: GumC family protein [unclassified Tolypothrix]|uniref:GumC family protein n=1 Tax=unclassified Tolypothrix TaxID=2649714 RepID=UPI0005EAB01F|nr:MULTISPECIES: polysaccharide biosynthesis tyrosine autokinase [unclassified Tolypothrix]BAY90676.1 lipopolysaccharide biosynthesis protein [Microchaete diplosiphon NIES-3275]EKF01431.1 lipopolysaccharide biosynthesis protein [Tolypothrix sp. PCC 7601]MBE9088009.1 polysaccharide biosynthesis tyrosine autokinase [Tolypothrix sp. LEGE 11397]UYD24824.1 polysaccharide biosynthesis tyrosine autokinase [Tolypothrix sp. PCC 7712]UYD32944.1 polysaccharide biosynthesis tyrosine autokinase [Tolypothri
MTPPIVKRYIIAFEKYKWIGLASFTLVVAGSTVVAIQPDPPVSYVANSALTYNRPPVSFSTTGTEIQQQGQELNAQVLLSNELIESVAAKVNVKPKTLGNNVELTLPKKNARSGQLESTIIELKYKDSNPKRAVEVLSVLMQAMVKLSGDINTGRLKSIIKKIDERLPEAKVELQLAEKKLEQYDRRERPAILASENGSLLTAVTTSQNQQRQLQFTIAGVDAQIRSLQDKLGLNVNQAYVSSALSADPIIGNLRSQIYQVESQIELLRKDLRPEHPNMIQLQRQKDAAEELLKQRAAEVVGGGGTAAPLAGDALNIRTQSNLDPARQELANQMVTLQTQRETLQQQLAQQIKEEARLRQVYSLIPNKQLERSRLEQEVTLKKAVYDKMQAKLADAQTAEAETVTSLSLARQPVAIADAVKPKSMPMTLAVGGLMGLVIGGGVIFLLGSLEGVFKTREDIRESLKQREVALLGELPLMPVDDLDKEAIPVLLSPDSPYLEFYEKFRSNVRRLGGKTLKVLLIASVGKTEGKTTSAYNLGIASARAGKRTLIIETDLRSPSSCTSLKVTPDPDANIEPLRYYGSLSECIHIVPDIENLYIIPSPGPLRQSAAILESSEMRRLMEDVRERYDLVILDTNPLSLSNDALLIQPYSDAMVIVARPNYTQENLLGEAIDQLVESELGLLGGIINGADINVVWSGPVEPSPNFPSPEEAGAEVSVGANNN